MDDDLVLDANAVAGDLAALFGFEVTALGCRCAHCGHQGEMGSLRAWTHGPGVVLRCSICGEVMLRWVRAPGGVRIDLRGVALLELPGT